MYIEDMPPEVIRLHTRPTCTPVRFLPLANHFPRSLMHRIDVLGDRLLVISKLGSASNPPAPCLQGILGGWRRVL